MSDWNQTVDELTQADTDNPYISQMVDADSEAALSKQKKAVEKDESASIANDSSRKLLDKSNS